jgi:hypothetical protein
MGSIQHIYSPDKWKIIFEGKSRIIQDDLIYKMEIGYCDDELSQGEIYIFISKENYEKILNGIYTINTFPYSNQKIIITDENNNVITLIKGKEDNEYSSIQKSYIKKIKKQVNHV